MILRTILFLLGQNNADAAFVPTDSLERLRPELNPDKLCKLRCIQAISCQNGGCEKDLFKKRSVSGIQCVFTCAKVFDPKGPLNKFKCFLDSHSCSIYHFLQMDIQPLKADWLRASALPAAWLCCLAACSPQTASHFLCIQGWSESTAWASTDCNVEANNVTNHGW